MIVLPLFTKPWCGLYILTTHFIYSGWRRATVNIILSTIIDFESLNSSESVCVFLKYKIEECRVTIFIRNQVHQTGFRNYSEPISSNRVSDFLIYLFTNKNVFIFAIFLLKYINNGIITH